MLIDNFVLSISSKMKSKYPLELPERDVLEYALKFIITNVIPIITIILYGIVSDNLINILLSLGAFSLLRMFSGGYHIKSPELCIVTSIALIISLGQFGYLMADYIVLMNIISLILVIIYAPSNIRKQTLIPEKYDMILKLISCVIILINIYINNTYVSISILAQSILLIRPLKGGEKE
ncbi:accessory gene regulator B family protein [Paenibacillus sp. ISL-20]|uniref:accessory gene regulator B family protein n=1 Tax=Paenibacillus sp. ISL-20 TaxID=2819163 RepID=UPI001BE5F046|nr:accessory gene regulator B family protein [Paenibacillus sp. ISL-20]MBT2759909.1 accessory gene regulator B family protein [Paenibacillus sp. ISL-20]